MFLKLKTGNGIKRIGRSREYLPIPAFYPKAMK